MNLRTLPADEPALVSAAVSSILTAVATFGVHLPGPQIVGVAAASFWTTNLFVRQAVTPNTKLPPAGK